MSLKQQVFIWRKHQGNHRAPTCLDFIDVSTRDLNGGGQPLKDCVCSQFTRTLRKIMNEWAILKT